MYGTPLNAEEWASVTVPTLVAYGAKSPAVLQQGSLALAEVLPNAELRELEGVSHNVKMNVLARVLAEFLAIRASIAAPLPKRLCATASARIRSEPRIGVDTRASRPVQSSGAQPPKRSLSRTSAWIGRVTRRSVRASRRAWRRRAQPAS
jgi:hypothetical protein